MQRTAWNSRICCHKPGGTVRCIPDGGDSRSSDPMENPSEVSPAEQNISAEEPAKTRRRRSKQDAKAVAAETENVAEAVREHEEKETPVYHTPPLNLLKRGKKGGGDSDAHLRATAKKLEQTLQNFGGRCPCDQRKLRTFCHTIRTSAGTGG